MYCMPEPGIPETTKSFGKYMLVELDQKMYCVVTIDLAGLLFWNVIAPILKDMLTCSKLHSWIAMQNVNMQNITKQMVKKKDLQS